GQLSVKRLKDPYVEATDFLARELDQTLMKHRKWRHASDTLSRALQVLREVYLAYGAMGKKDPDVATQLESLDGEYRAKVLEKLTKIEEPATRISRADWAMLQERRVEIRRESRLQAFRIDIAQMKPFLDVLRTTTPTVARGNFFLLEGSYGAGKSEQADTWLLQQIEKYRLHEGMPVPLHVDARDVEQASIEGRLAADVGLTALRTQGVALVVDGLDEIRSERASRVLDDANTLVLTYSEAKVLLTSRSGVLDGHRLLHARNHHEQAPLDLDTALSLITSIGGTTLHAALANPVFKPSIQLPFFALAAAVGAREGKVHSSRAGLIRDLVDHAIRPPGAARTSIGTTEVHSTLGRLATNTTRRHSQDGLNESERLRLLETGLVVGGHDVVDSRRGE
ncbi:hypothetical protein, partial [Nesterenkonia marinintestina]|uniref:hypothetical protein n=1 Tax=Nesterenkonia marinintestina TaxID=2979865 RepID=UPI0021C1ECEA